MAKADWGTKQTCPKCGTRFYDLGKEPAVCIDCGNSFVPEPVLKSKQPLPEAERKPVKAPVVSSDSEDEEDIDVDIEVEDEEEDESLTAVSLDDDGDLSDIVDNSLEEDD